MPDILRKLQKAYNDNPVNASYLLPELIQEIERGNIIEKIYEVNSINPCEICGIKKALKCIKHDSICNKKKKYEEYRMKETNVSYPFGYPIPRPKAKE